MSRLVALFMAAVLAGSMCLAQKAPANDGQITDSVRMKLASDPVVKGGAISVDVKNGVVTLSGPVDQPRAKDRAEKLAKTVKGVKQVVNKITVK